jgi:hypothetical protein
MSEEGSGEIPLVSREEAIAEVRRWLDEEGVDPEGVFTAMGDQIIRYKDLIAQLEQETPDGRLLRLAISRGRGMRSARSQSPRSLLQIAQTPPMPDGGGGPPVSGSSGTTPPTA